MPTPEWLDYMTGSVQQPALDMNMRILAALAAIASGSNPDGTASPSGSPFASFEAADILTGNLNFAATGGPTTIITIPAGRIWVGSVSINVTAGEVAAGTAQPVMQAWISTAGAGVTPAAGTYWQCNTSAGANAATGLSGDGGSNAITVSGVVVVAPVGNAVQLQATCIGTGSVTLASCNATGLLQ